MTSKARERRGRFVPAWFGLAGSLITHGSIALALLVRFGGHVGGGGENGRAGAGDTSIDVSLAGAPAAKAAPAPTAPPAPQPSAPEKASEKLAAPAPRVKKSASPSPMPMPPSTPSPGSDATTNGGRLPGPVNIGLAGLGGDTVEGQRAMLPRAAVCKDPVAGKWEALKFSPRQSDWVHFTLFVRRDGGVLRGTILSHTWSGGVFDRVPPGCGDGGFDLTVSMKALGHADGESIRFGAFRGYSLVSVRCAMPYNDYAPDHFIGRIDPARQEFQSLNNDGANDVNAPYVFRRTGCLDP